MRLIGTMLSEYQSQRIGLGQFIRQNLEAILQRWEDFARSIWPGQPAEVVVLRNDAAKMLEAVVIDMSASQSPGEQIEKSEGHGTGKHSDGIDSAALLHALSRVDSGFDIVKLVAEFRAMRAAVSRIWTDSSPVVDARQIEEMLRFNEAIDQLVAASVSAFSERVERSRSIFLGMIGHDMRQPLQTINILVEMLSHSASQSSEIGTVQEHMKLASSQLTALLSDLLDFNTGQVGAEMPIRREPADLTLISHHLVSGFRVAHPAKDIRLEMSGDLTGEWDNTRMRQLITNLVSNAIVHGAGKSIHVALRGNQESVEIEVRNWGPPIPAEALPNLFNPMVRLAKDEVSRPHGSIGLGLYICRQIAHAHGGIIRVESSASEGTAFIVEMRKFSSGKIGRSA